MLCTEKETRGLLWPEVGRKVGRDEGENVRRLDVVFKAEVVGFVEPVS